MNSTQDCRSVLAASRHAITPLYRADEASCVSALLEQLASAGLDFPAIAGRATQLVQAVRVARQGASGVDNLMHEFSLSSLEGVALMCLAEALLRIPDSATRDRLIRDKISQGDWRAHLGHSGSLFVNAATWGLMITGRLVATHRETALSSTLTRLVARGGEPVIRRGVEFAMTLLGQQFVMGETIEQALERSRENIRRGYTHSFDMLGEAALTAADAERYAQAYEAAIHAIGKSAGAGVVHGPGISVKLSALHPRYSRAQRDRVLGEMYPRLLALANLACDYSIGFNIDAEEAERLELSLDLIDRLAGEATLAGWDGLGVVVQAYQKRGLAVIRYLATLARGNGRRLMVRLVKGAYWDAEIKRSQVDGQAGYPVFTRKAHTDLSYLVCAHELLRAADVLYPQFATHNAHTLASIEHMARALDVSEYEFQCLHGMGESLYDNVLTATGAGGRCRIYAPVGRHETLLPYLVRRLLENGANSSFVNRIVDENVGIAELVADPVTQTLAHAGTPHPLIPLPRDLYGSERCNSAGVDLSDEITLCTLTADLDRLRRQSWQATPLLASGVGAGGDQLDIRNPANQDDLVGTVREASAADIERALADAADYSEVWHARPVAERAALLRRAADLIEARSHEFISLCVREAGKTWSNAVAEIREAVDFCRYYAARVEQLPTPAAAPGPVVCISPWNFPLAIFLGEVSAALAAGSPVLAKPAEQTPLIASLAVGLLHEAGIPRGALQLLPGRGEKVGAAMTADRRIQGVIFTGSTEVAQMINRTLARRPAGAPEACLIAETGGQNAMLVDSSALAEQVVQDVLVSGFDSAGQRCSALRVLYLQEDIADHVLDMLRAAMRELRIGNPEHLATDVGPVIDADARRGLEAHIAEMRRRGHPVFQCELPAACEAGLFVAPTLIEIERLEELAGEVFGPVVHVLRFSGEHIDGVVEAVNATGYGLTFGMHSRIDEAIEQVTTRIHAGNIYINRNMVGAVVGVQPFGGHGKSGTGPKAGGPFYLPRLLGLAAPATAALGLLRDTETCPQLANFAELAAWANRMGMRDLSVACAEYAAASPLACRAGLPGPTGEINTLDFAARGAVLCLADSVEALYHQLAAVLATGNTPVLEKSAPVGAPYATLPDAIKARLRWVEQRTECIQAAILFCGEDSALACLRLEMAALDGPLVPVFGVECSSGLYPLYRLVTEKLVSVNTTAAGGNASLMTLGA